MAIQNPRFEKPGLYPGEAEGWTLRTHSSLWEFAGFGDEPEVAWERFDRWYEYFGSLESTGFVLAFFDNKAEGYEDFNENWMNDLYLRELPSGHVQTLGIEMMAIQPYAVNFEETLIAEFNGKTLEQFNLDGYIADFDTIENELSNFADGADIENFDQNHWI